jgi:resuscitation-promoting factor RpfB
MELAKQRLKAKAKKVADHPLGLPVLLFLTLTSFALVGGFFAFQSGTPQLSLRNDENFIAIVTDEDKEYSVPTNADTVGDFLKAQKVQLASGDRVEPAKDAPITGDNFKINIYRSVPIVVIEANKTVHVKTAAASARSAVQTVGVSLYNEDIVRATPTENFVTQGSIGERLEVDRSTPIELTLYGAPAILHTHAPTVADLLKQRNVKLTKEDTVKPALNTPISPNLKVAVIRNGIQVVTVSEVVPAPQETIIDGSLSFGSQAVRQEGSPGRVSKTYRITVEGGNEVKRELLQSVTILEPVKRIVAKGNTVNIPANKQAVLAAAGISPNDYAYVDYIFSRESRWNAAALNASGCGGLGQACPSSKLARVCPEWQSDPVCQTKFFTGYAVGRYGSWQGAYNAWLTKRWW